MSPAMHSLAGSSRTMTTAAAKITRKPAAAIPVRIRHYAHSCANRNQISQPMIKNISGPMT